MKQTIIGFCLFVCVIFNVSVGFAQDAETDLEETTPEDFAATAPELVPLTNLNTEGIPQNMEQKKEPEGELEVMPLSGTVVRHNPAPKKLKLTIAPEVFIGGTFSNYRNLGFFAFFDFGAGLGVTLDEKWHFKLSVLALSETHRFTPAGEPLSTTGIAKEEHHDVWFIQPAAYVMYNVAHFPDYHYWVPMDLFIGAKFGANIFRVDEPFYNVSDKNDFLWGVAMNARFYIYKRFGIAGVLELSTVDYFRNFFFHYGASLFWDFEVMGKDEEF